MITRILIILLLSFPVKAFAETAVTSPESGVKAIIISDIDAITKVYGGPEIFDKIFEKRFHSNHAYVNPTYSVEFTENRLKKKYVIFHLKDENDDFVCHACAPYLGIGLFRFQDNQWVLEASTKYIKWQTAWGVTYSLVEYGKDKHGILSHIEDIGQGYETKINDLFIPYHNEILHSFHDGFVEKPGPGACEWGSIENSSKKYTDKSRKQKANIKFVKNGSEYYDIISILRYNEGSCQIVNEVKGIHTEHKFIFNDGKYE